MPRSIAAPTPTFLSIAIHATLLVALIGVRFDASERASFGVVEVEWFLVAERIDEGAAGVTGSSAPVAAVETLAADGAPVPDPPARDGERSAAAAPSSAGTAKPRAAAASAVPSAEAATPAAMRAPPVAIAAATPPPSVDTAAAAATDRAFAVAPVSFEAYRPEAPSFAPAVAVESPDVLTAARVRAPPDTSDPALPQDPLTAKIEALTVDVDALAASERVVFDHEGREYTASFTRQPAADDTSLDQLIVAVSTESSGERRSTEMRFKRVAFSHFAQFVDRWDPAVRIHDDEIDGRFHANSEIYVDSSGGIKPKFHGKVTTSRGVSTSATGRFRRADVFLGGIETRIRKIALPAELAMFPSAADSDGRIHRFAGSARITFHADGSYGWQLLDASEPEQRRRLSDRTSYLIGDEGAELHVNGVVNGRVLVHSPERIVIEGNLTYAVHPDSESGADDYLGLVSDKNVEVADPEVTGPGDLDVHASIFAKRRFVIRRYRAREHATLSILGSVTAGSLSASEPRYRTKLRYDRRLDDVRPPSFPTTDRYELASWDGRWLDE
jgi:hypothetical protein